MGSITQFNVKFKPPVVINTFLFPSSVGKAPKGVIDIIS